MDIVGGTSGATLCSGNSPVGSVVCKLTCEVKDTVSKRGIKCVREGVKEFEIQELWDKDARCLYDWTDIVTSSRPSI